MKCVKCSRRNWFDCFAIGCLEGGVMAFCSTRLLQKVLVDQGPAPRLGFIARHVESVSSLE